MVQANYKTALVGGLLIGLIPAWLVSVLVSLFPALRTRGSGRLYIKWIWHCTIVVFYDNCLHSSSPRGIDF